MNLFSFSKNKKQKIEPSSSSSSSSSSPQQNPILQTNLTKIQEQCAKGKVATLDTCVLNNDNLKTFALIQTILEIYDADHDLNRSKYDKNPLVEYCKSFENFPKRIVINDRVIEVNDTDFAYIYNDDNWNSTSQSAIKKNMETILKGLEQDFPGFLSAFGRIPFTSSITSENKQLTHLQGSLKTKNIDLTLVETHRGGSPNNVVIMNNKSIMLKPMVSTRFDLGSKFPIIENTDIQPGFCGLSNNNNYNFDTQPPTSPLCRFFSNYFPNSFTIVIKNTELTKDGLQRIFSEMGDYFKIFEKNSNDVAEIVFTQIQQKKRLSSQFFADGDGNNLYLLHMFTDSAREIPTFSLTDSAKNKPKPTFSIQKGPITADQVTNELYGVRHRCFSSKTQITTIEQTLLILDNNITPNVRFCHILYAKTCGDGVAIEATKISSKVFGITVNLLSNDVCCNYRNAFVNGFSTRQAPSSFAGTSFGVLSKNRNVEIMTMINPTTTTLSQCIEKIINEYENSPDIEPLESSIKKNELIIDGIDQSALDDILTCAYRKIYIDEYNDDTKAKQTQITNLINKLDSEANLEINKEDCDLLKELCANRQLLFIKEKVDNSFENFKNRLKNILKKIQIDYPELIQARPSNDVQIAFTIERGISLVSSLEQLLGEVYPCDNNDVNDELGLKKIVLYFLTVVIQKSISATRIIGRYIEMLKRRLIDTIEDQLTDTQGLNSYSSYEELLRVFNKVFGRFEINYQNDDNELTRYKRRQQAKQPLNLLKFILRSIEANNKWTTSINGIKEYLTDEPTGKLYKNPAYSNLYQYIYDKYKDIIEDSGATSPFATQDIINKFSQYSQDIINKFSLESQIQSQQSGQSLSETELKEMVNKNLPDLISNDLANLNDDKKIKEKILEYIQPSSQDEIKIDENLAKPDLYIIGSKTGESPESMNPFNQPSLDPISPQKVNPNFTVTTPSPKKPARSDDDFVESQKQEDSLSVALGPAIYGEAPIEELAEEEELALKEELAEEETEALEAGGGADSTRKKTVRMLDFGGKPSRRTKHKRNKITRNKKSKNNQTKKQKRTKRN